MIKFRGKTAPNSCLGVFFPPLVTMSLVLGYTLKTSGHANVHIVKLSGTPLWPKPHSVSQGKPTPIQIKEQQKLFLLCKVNGILSKKVFQIKGVTRHEAIAAFYICF